MHRIYTIFLMFLLTSLYACGPITAHSTIARAHIALEAARGAEAQKYAIYQYRSAELYLKKAKEEEGYSSFQEAVDLAKISRSFADKARARALKRKRVVPRTPVERQRMNRTAPANIRPVPSPGPSSTNSPVIP